MCYIFGVEQVGRIFVWNVISASEWLFFGSLVLFVFTENVVVVIIIVVVIVIVILIVLNKFWEKMFKRRPILVPFFVVLCDWQQLPHTFGIFLRLTDNTFPIKKNDWLNPKYYITKSSASESEESFGPSNWDPILRDFRFCVNFLDFSLSTSEGFFTSSHSSEADSAFPSSCSNRMEGRFVFGRAPVSDWKGNFVFNKTF